MVKYIIKKSKIDGKYYAYCKKTGDKIGGSSRTFVSKTLKGIKKQIKQKGSDGKWVIKK